MKTPRLLAGFIGINRHLDAEIPELSCARRDATALWALWQDTLPATSPCLLVDEAATHVGIEQLLTRTLDEATEHDTVLLTFSGHGTHNHRLVAYDTSLNDLAATTIAMASLAERFRRSRARHILLVLDCCFSGGAPAKVIEDGLLPRGAGYALEEAFTGRGRVLLAAANVTEEAWESGQHGLLTAALLAALRAASGELAVTSLLTEVSGRVQAEAQRLGAVQTPRWVGEVEGSFALPALQAGPHYYRAFPEQTGLRVSNSLRELSGFGLPEEVLMVWERQFPAGLNELQLAAINEYRVLDGQSLLVVAPTSSGKTFIGELAAVRAAVNTRRTVFLVPYKALANEKYEQFVASYEQSIGLRVIRCTGDYQDATSAFVRGKYDLALLTYEMFLSLLVSRPGVLNRIGAVVLDEAQFITNPGRGISVELLLTYLLTARERGLSPQLVALSAVIGDTNGFEHWLQCRALVHLRRPVPLEEGVIDRAGVFEYVDPATNQAYTTQLLPSSAIVQRGKEPSNQDVIVPLVRQLLAQATTAKVIVFRNMRGKAEGVAGYLARDLHLPGAPAVAAALPAQDQSRTAIRLRECLRGGTAFHNSNLAREEREVIERAFRDPKGGIRVLGATTTIAAGINTPASAVILGETEFTGEDQQPFTIAEYKNMAGRAGRLGYNERGQSFIIARNAMERRHLFQHYVLGRPEDLASSFNSAHLATWVLRLLAQVGQVPRAEVARLLANTYGGYVASRENPAWRPQVQSQLGYLLEQLLSAGIVEQVEDMLRLTVVGEACATSTLSFESVLRLLQLLRRLSITSLTLTRLLALTQALPELDETYTPLFKNGTKEKSWPHEVAQQLGGDLASLYQQSLPSGSGVGVAYLRRSKRALLVEAWLAGTPLEDLEERFTNSAFVPVNYGDIRRIVDATRFHLRSVVPIVQALYPAVSLPDDALNELATRLEVGLSTPALSLLRVTGLTRGEILLLHRHGMSQPQAGWAAVAPVVEAVLGTARAQQLAANWPKPVSPPAAT
ncbi:DEAD/DEAH box helicase (plasmid) [Hymenobacter tibetensis]|uniref:DEAD/DEAH box helicase n=1 Tax=Hymenobacter tibetensis TaxID=497967 RepID=A0ABY4D8V8_9BACT|nr:DEAD/DEAH box helicase [Hymenobacter tibetensis]UOG77651.1 DEAD/DEAH box helicase [Hymenobacter tibetensis]